MKPKPTIQPRHIALPLAVCSALLIALSGCQLPNSKKLEEASKETPIDPSTQLYPEPANVDLSPESQELNDAARLLAGLNSLADSDIHKKWRSEAFWKNYNQGADFIWNEFASKRGKKVREWAAAEVADLNAQPVVFQPFGGPNFVFAHLLFPEAETFVLCGKEPCVDLPKLQETTPGTMADTVAALREVQAALTEFSQSSTAIAGGPDSLKGAVPALLALAARTGHVVESIELMPEEALQPMPTDPANAPAPQRPDDAGAQSEHPTSACVLSLRGGGGKARRIFYFQQSLTDDGLPESSALLQFLNKQDKVVVVLNSTSYDLHKPNCSRLQQYLLSHAAAVVQDPSGLPVRLLARNAWNVRCYGSYAAAPDEFRDYDQPDLIAAFEDKDNRPGRLPFGRGTVSEESPAAIIVARPLLAAHELPFDTGIVPLEPQPADETPLLTTPPISNAKPVPPAPAVMIPKTPNTAPEPEPTEKSEPAPPASPVAQK